MICFIYSNVNLVQIFSLGFILGPAIGGSVVHINPKLPAQIAAGLSLINLIRQVNPPLIKISSNNIITVLYSS